MKQILFSILFVVTVAGKARAQEDYCSKDAVIARIEAMYLNEKRNGAPIQKTLIPSSLTLVQLGMSGEKIYSWIVVAEHRDSGQIIDMDFLGIFDSHNYLHIDGTIYKNVCWERSVLNNLE